MFLAHLCEEQIGNPMCSQRGGDSHFKLSKVQRGSHCVQIYIYTVLYSIHNIIYICINKEYNEYIYIYQQEINIKERIKLSRQKRPRLQRGISVEFHDSDVWNPTKGAGICQCFGRPLFQKNACPSSSSKKMLASETSC